MSRTYRMSIGSFNRFAPFIGGALLAWPRPVRVNTSLRPSGFLQPCRDAIKAKTEHGYEHPSIDNALFKQHGSALSVFERDGGIWIGPRPSNTRPLAVSFEEEQPRESYVLTNTESFLDDLCRMVGSQAFTPMPTFVVKGIDTAVKSILSSRYQVAFVAVEGQADTYQIV